MVMPLAFTLMYSQCMANAVGCYADVQPTYGQCSWQLHCRGDYKNSNDVGYYVDVWLMYGQCSSLLCWGRDYKSTNAVGCYVGVLLMYGLSLWQLH